MTKYQQKRLRMAKLNEEEMERILEEEEDSLIGMYNKDKNTLIGEVVHIGLTFTAWGAKSLYNLVK